MRKYDRNIVFGQIVSNQVSQQNADQTVIDVET